MLSSKNSRILNFFLEAKLHGLSNNEKEVRSKCIKIIISSSLYWTWSSLCLTVCSNQCMLEHHCCQCNSLLSWQPYHTSDMVATTTTPESSLLIYIEMIHFLSLLMRLIKEARISLLPHSSPPFLSCLTLVQFSASHSLLSFF